LKITISHPHGSLFSYHAARALEEKNWLNSFQTGVTRHSAVSKLLSHLSRDSEQRLFNRSYKGIQPQRQQSHIWWEAISRLGKRVTSRGLSSQVKWYDVLFYGHDWQVAQELEGENDAVYAYEDGARKTFIAAKRQDIATIYELPAGYYLGPAGEFTVARNMYPSVEVDPIREPVWKQRRKNEELELADLVVCPSGWASESLKYAPQFEKRVVVVPYGTPADEIAKRAHKPDREFTILFAGRISLGKGVPYLLEAWKKLNLRDARLVLAGSIHLDHNFLKDYAGYYQHVGHLPRIQLMNELRSADLFVFPSLAEGFGMVIGEAMAVGVPVLTTVNTGGPELITDGKEGWCIPTHDIASLVERIEWSYHHRDSLYDMGNLARRRAEQWSWADYRRKLSTELSKFFGSGSVSEHC
jgi:glycosyltransferase involved in cell wall biosynthesis